MIVLARGDLVLPDRILSDASLVLDGNRIASVETRPRAEPSGAVVIDVSGCYVVPGFVDVHVHGVQGVDTLDEGAPVAQIAAALPRYGVTAFCPTTVACPPAQLRDVLAQVRSARAAPVPRSARVLPAHLESNFINPEYRGAQPADCLRSPADAARASTVREGDFSASDILAAIAASRPDVGIVTLAPELPGGLDLVRALVAAGHRVSLGHSGAAFDEAIAAIEAGARHATHLFNRMTPVAHREPGVAGAVLSREDVAAELVCDGYHVHPGMCRVAIAAKGTHGIMAITDGTGGSGLPPGSFARLGGRRIRVSDEAVVLDDGTLAGSSLTMDRAFRTIVNRFGRSIVDAAMMCATTPARQLGLHGCGAIAEGAIADLAVLDRDCRVVYTFLDGQAGLPQGRDRVGGGVVNARVGEPVAALPALAASPAVASLLRVHAGERQLERHAELDAEPDHLALVHRRKRRDDLDRLCETKRQRARHCREELGRGIGKRIARERTDRDAADAMAGAVDRSLGEQHDVAPLEVDVFIRRVERGRLPTQRPVRRGIKIPDRECESRERLHARGKRRAGQQAFEGGNLLGFPREPGADVKRVHAPVPRFCRRENSAVEAR